MIEFKCPACGQPMETEYQSAGKKANCLKCNALVDVPWPDFLPRIQCPHCKAELDFPMSAAGTIQSCNKCGGIVHVPDPKGGPTSGCAALMSLVCLLVALLAWVTTGVLR